jgi:hypothetical protein
VAIIEDPAEATNETEQRKSNALSAAKTALMSATGGGFAV